MGNLGVRANTPSTSSQNGRNLSGGCLLTMADFTTWRQWHSATTGLNPVEQVMCLELVAF